MTDLSPPEGCVWQKEAARKIGVKPETLRTWRYLRKGPPSFKVAGRVAYEIEAIDAYLAECKAADSHYNPALNPVLRAPEPRIGRAQRAA